MQFEGDQDFPQQPSALWAKLRDASFIAECIPDGSSEGTPTRDQARCSVRPGFSFVRGTLDVVATITESEEPTMVKALLASKGIGSTSDVEVILNLAPQGDGTRVHWQAQIKTLGGLLKMVPAGLIKGAAQKVVDDLWTSIRQKLAG